MNTFNELLGKKTRVSVGFTHINRNKKNKTIIISHGGNMGNSIKHSVNPNLEMLGFPTVEELRENFNVVKEEGSPDYMWVMVLSEKTS